MSDQLYDVALVEDGRISIVTYWKAIEPLRAMRLADREQKNHGDMTGLVPSGTGRMGQKIKIVEKTLTIPKYVLIDTKNGRRPFKEGEDTVTVRLLEVDNS